MYECIRYASKRTDLVKRNIAMFACLMFEYALAHKHAANFAERLQSPIAWNHPYLSPLVPRPQFHTNPIAFRWPSTRLASTSTSAPNAGMGVA